MEAGGRDRQAQGKRHSGSKKHKAQSDEDEDARRVRRRDKRKQRTAASVAALLAGIRQPAGAAAGVTSSMYPGAGGGGVEALRAERARREAAERSRTQRLLAGGAEGVAGCVHDSACLAVPILAGLDQPWGIVRKCRLCALSEAGSARSGERLSRDGEIDSW